MVLGAQGARQTDDISGTSAHQCGMGIVAVLSRKLQLALQACAAHEQIHAFGHDAVLQTI
jgi:hypothetical protein